MTKQNILIRMLALFLIVINLGSSFGVYAQEPELLSPILKSDDKNTDILFDGEVDDPSEEEINAPWLLNREDELSSFSFESFIEATIKAGKNRL